MIKINPKIKRLNEFLLMKLTLRNDYYQIYRISKFPSKNLNDSTCKDTPFLSIVQTFFQIVAIIFENMSKCATYVQETYFYFLKKEKKKATITFQRRKLSKRETALNFFLFHSSSKSTGDEKKNEHDDANFLNRHVTTVRSTKIIIKVYTSRMKVWRNRTVVKVKLVR